MPWRGMILLNWFSCVRSLVPEFDSSHVKRLFKRALALKNLGNLIFAKNDLIKAV